MEQIREENRRTVTKVEAEEMLDDAAMALAGYAVELIFWLLHITPTVRNTKVLEPSITMNYTSILNIVFLLISVALVWRFLRTGGPKMLRMMNRKPDMSTLPRQ